MNLLEPQNILFIKEFPYENGGIPTDKLIIVLSNDKFNSLILLAKTTSKQHCPDVYKKHGCTNNLVNRISHYCFEPKRVIGKNSLNFDFYFPEYTFIYFAGNNIFEVNSNKYLLELKSKTKFYAKMDTREFKRFLKCSQGSFVLQRNIKSKITEIYKSL
jgi:hypothetical protein